MPVFLFRIFRIFPPLLTEAACICMMRGVRDEKNARFFIIGASRPDAEIFFPAQARANEKSPRDEFRGL